MNTPGHARLTGTEPVSAFLADTHLDLARRLGHLRDRELRTAGPLTDDQARIQARALLETMGGAGVYQSIGTGDLRALCLAREMVAFASPLADAVLALQALGGMPLVLAGTGQQRDRWLAPILAGGAMAAFAMSEPEAGSDVAAMRTTARRTEDGWVLDGGKHLISNAGIADVYVVFAVTTPHARSRGISAFLVPARTPGLTFAGAQVLAEPHPLGRLRFEACRVPADALLGEVDAGFTLGMTVLDRLRPSVGAAACGMAARALVEALEHVSARHQFGAPLASFQLIREKLGRMATELEAARLLVYRAAWQQDCRGSRITIEAAMSKSFATEAAQRIVDEAVQIVGGLGVVVGHPVERLYRAVRALRIYEGTTDIQRLVIAGELLGRPPRAAEQGRDAGR